MTTSDNIALWDKIFSTRGWGRWPCEDLVRFVSRTFPGTDRPKALEVGCGTGANLDFLSSKFYVYAIDRSAEAIKKVHEDYGPPSDFVVGDFSTLPWKSDFFDFVCDIESIYANTPETIDATLKEVHRVLKPGGWFFGKMFGVGTSEKIFDGYGAYHLFNTEELSAYFRGYSHLSVDWATRTDRGNIIHEWLVQAQK